MLAMLLGSPWTRTRGCARGRLVVLVLVVLVCVAGAESAAAAPTCSTSAGVTSCSFGFTGQQDSFSVPADVSSVGVEAVGAPGAVGEGGRAAGRGARVVGDLAVTAGQTLYVNVGGAPTIGACHPDPAVACHGGFNGGGSSYFGGGGGGASDVRSVSGSLGSRLIVAAGGGGSGQYGYCPPGDDPVGGAGGDAGSPGGDGDPCAGTAGGTGGGAGNQSQGGAGGIPRGEAGVLGQGGNGGLDTGGGGGGGLYGGGGGGNFVFASLDTDTAAGGGGGGSSLVPTGGSVEVTDAPASVTISYVVADTTAPVSTATPGPGDVPAGQSLVTVTASATFRNTAGAVVGTIAPISCWNTRGTRVRLEASDEAGGSGVASLTYAATGAQPIAPTTVTSLPATVTITAPGVTRLTYSAIDRAGNREQQRSLSVLVAPIGRYVFTCAAPTPSFTIPSHGSIHLTGTATSRGHTYPFKTTINY